MLFARHQFIIDIKYQIKLKKKKTKTGFCHPIDRFYR